MKLKVLGNSGPEFDSHNMPAFLIDGCLLLDAGTIGWAKKEFEKSKIPNILITHSHLDHIKGIPFLADSLYMKHKGLSVTVISIPSVLQGLKNNLFNNVLWPDFTRIPDRKKPVLKLKKITAGKRFQVFKHTVIAYGVNHSVPAVGYVIEDVRGKRILYTGDTGPTDLIWKTTGRIDCVIMEVSFPNKMEQFAIRTGHLTPRLVAEELQKIAWQPGKILINPQKPLYLKQINREIKSLKMKNVTIVKDGDEYEV